MRAKKRATKKKKKGRRRKASRKGVARRRGRVRGRTVVVGSSAGGLNTARPSPSYVGQNTFQREPGMRMPLAQSLVE